MNELDRSKKPKRLPPSKGRAYWEATLLEWENSSGVNQRVFCQRRGCSLSTFTHWKRKLRLGAGGRAPSPGKVSGQGAFVELTRVGGGWESPLRLEFPFGGGSAGLILRDREHLRAVLEEMKAVLR
jgi:hypothetical protein